MNEPLESHYLVIDLEATCDDRNGLSRREMEIIEIGAVLVLGDTLETIGEYQTFVRPVRHPVLTPFCTRLTSITQADVDAAPGFAQAIAAFGAFLRTETPSAQPLFCSWGGFDKTQFEQDASFHGVELPFGHRHLNLKEQFSSRQGLWKKYGMAAALEKVGLALVGTHHRGLDDARNIARLLPWILGRR
jgi:inhibitor of KinA sporulation pathway (predicted exonuclease)